MTRTQGDLALLDTNVLIHLVRNDATGQVIEEKYSLAARQERPLLSTVVEAEVKVFAAIGGWGDRKLARLDEILAELVRVEAGLPQVVEAYIEIAPVAQRQGQSIATQNQNDLWIAATARAAGAVLYTCDKDFQFLDPDFVRVCYIPPA